MSDLNARMAITHCWRCARTPRGQIHCHRCGIDKPRTEFYRDRKRGPYAYHGGCKDCRREQSRNQTTRVRSHAA